MKRDRRVRQRCRDGRRRAALLSLAAAGVGRHHRALVPVDGAGRRPRRADRDRTRLWRPAAAPRARRLRRADARDADPAAALRPLLRHRGGDPIARLCGGAARAGAELRRLRERDLPLGARSGLGRSARSGPNAGLERAPGAQAHPRTAGVPAGARADDQRFRRAAQGLVARVGPDGAGADEGNADLRDESGELGHSGHDVRGAVSGDVVAAGRRGAAPRTALEARVGRA